MQARQKSTVQRWLQTMRGIDVEWEDHIARSLYRIKKESDEPEESTFFLSEYETLRYLATGLIEWEKRLPDERSQPPDALRLGMSRMYLSSLLCNEKAPANLRDFFIWAKQPVSSWSPAQTVDNLSPYVTLLEDGEVSDFARQWQMEGVDTVKQVEESIMLDVLEYCRAQQLEDSYRSFRYLIITQPLVSFLDYRRLSNAPEMRPLKRFLQQVYVRLEDLTEDNAYYLCPRCKYVQKRCSDGTRRCRNAFCEQLCTKLKRPVSVSIPRDEVGQWMAVTPGIYQYVTLPGIWEVQLAEALTRLGIRITLWPQIDAFDLLVEFSRKVRWAIDVKDWSYLNREGLKRLRPISGMKETFVAFPNEREEYLRIKVMRNQLEPELNDIRMILFDEIISAAQAILGKKRRA